MTAASVLSKHKKKQRFNKQIRANKTKSEDGQKEIKAIIAKCSKLLKVTPSSFKRFTDLPLSTRTLQGLGDCDYEEPTDIQRESLPFSLNGSDVVGAAKTGSGKTLALIVPVLECLWKAGWSNYLGLGALIISPTRELALQTFTVINNVGKYHEFSCALLIGGTDVDYEKKRIGSVNIIICTPGRLLQHMDENEHLFCDQLQILVLDEADRILDMGFTQQINAIVANLPKERQTLLFSATQTRNVKDLSRVCTKDPVFVSAHERCVNATPDNLKQWYMICDEPDKINAMWSFIISHKKSKIIVFVSSCKQARFLTGAYCHLRPGLPVMGLWGTMNQKKRVDVFQKFENMKAAVMIATDVASRGLDFSDVDWVIQVDCPASVEDYIHRVGRTARMNQTGHAVLFLTSSQERGMTTALRQANIPLEKQTVDPNALVDIRFKMQAVLSQFPELNQHAQKSLVAYLRSIYLMKNKSIFDVSSINVAELAASFGLMAVPRVRFLSKKGLIISDSTSSMVETSWPSGFTSQSGNDHKNKINADHLGNYEVDEKDDLFRIRKNDVFSSLSDARPSAYEPNVFSQTTGTKVITKMEAARKLLNKKLKLSVRKVYDDEGEVKKVDGATDDTEETAGLNLKSAVESMQQSSLEDRKRHRELTKQKKKEEKAKLRWRKRKDRGDKDLALEGGSGIDSDADLSFLPDPDEVRKRYAEEYENRKKVINESDDAPRMRKRWKHREKLKNTEQQALALLNPF